MEKIAAHSSRIMLLKDGSIIAFDTPRKVFSLDALEEYGVNAPSFTRICKGLGMKHPETGCYPVTLEEAREAFGIYHKGVHNHGAN